MRSRNLGRRLVGRCMRRGAAIAVALAASTLYASGPAIDPGTVFDGHAFTAARASWGSDFALTDLDLDGRLDLIMSGPFGFDGLRRFRSDGRRFGARQEIDAPGLSPAVRAADLDEDGDDDLVLMGRGGLITTMWNEGGTLVATASLDVPATLGVDATTFYDTPHLVRTTTSEVGAAGWSLIMPSTLGTLEVSLGVDGAPVDVVIIHPDPSRAVALGDLDGDGARDLLVGTRALDGVVLRAEVDPRTGTWGSFEPFDDAAAGAIITGDVDLDGYEDVVVAVGPINDPVGPVRVLRGDGRGGVTLVAELERPDGQPALTLGDLDGDSWPELVVGKYGGIDASLDVWRGGPGGALEHWFTRITDDQTATMQLADVTGDDRLDVVITAGVDLRGAIVLVGRDDAPPGHETGRRGISPDDRPYWLFPGTPSELPFIARCDWVEDSLVLTLLRNRGDGTHVEGPAIEGLDFPSFPSLPPMIVADAEPFTHLALYVNFWTDVLQILRRHHDQVEQVASIPVSEETTGADLADLDGDGHLDVVSLVQTWTEKRLEVRLQKPGWVFEHIQDVELPGNDPDDFSVEAADVDGDGHVDLLLQRSDGELRVCWGIGDGTVTSSAIFSGPTFFPPPCRTKLIDADGDGMEDLLLVLGDDTVRVARQVRPRVFETASTIPAPTWTFGPTPVATGDIDGDGDLDAMTAPSSIGPLRWLENVTSDDELAFVERVAWRHGPEAAGYTDLEDMDGDGRADVVRRFFNIRVIRSLPPEPTWRADVTADGVVDMDDLLAVLDRWGSLPSNSPYIIAADVDRDHQVEYADLIAVLASWGEPWAGR